MNDSPFLEVIIKRKFDGNHLLFRLIGFLACLLFAFIWSFVIVIMAGHPAVIIFGMVICAFLVFLVIKNTMLEYEYSIVNGTFCFSKIYGKTRRNEIFCTDIKRIEMFGEYSASEKEKLKCSCDRVIFALSSSKITEAKYFVFSDEDDKKIAFVFEGDERIEKKIKSHKPSLFFGINKH